MMKQLFSLLLVWGMLAQHARSQIVFQVNAGSRAPWGTNQNLLVEKSGHCTYSLTEVNGPVKNSSSFDIPLSQLDALLAKAEELGFFRLKDKYDAGYSDGAGIFIAMRSSGKKHSVQLLNMDIPQINQLVSYLNRILEPHKIHIYYGQTPK